MLTHISRGIALFCSSEQNKTLTRESELTETPTVFQEEEAVEEEENRRRRVERQASRWVFLVTYISRGTVIFCFGELDTPLTCESEITNTPTVFRRRRRKRWRRRIADVVWNVIRCLVSGPSTSCYCPPACLFYHAAGEKHSCICFFSYGMVEEAC